MTFYPVIICFLVALVSTPIVIKLSIRFGVVDKPNHRKVHQKATARIGGTALYLSFLIGSFFAPIRYMDYFLPILFGSAVVFFVGFLDDLYDLRPRVKVIGQLIAATIVIFSGGIELEFINLFFGGTLHFGVFSVPITFFWIIGITNAVNLIDGLDGLAAGVSIIVLITMASLAFMMNDTFVFIMCLMLIGSAGGFLVFNFNPAKIFMGDSGALLLGFMISVLSLLGFKGATAISFIVPLIILGVPISDTFYAIVRRVHEKRPISAPDRSHLHHRLLRLGYSHRQAVLLIYVMSGVFGVIAIVYSRMELVNSVVLLCLVLITIEIFAEKIGLIHKDYRPILNIIRAIRHAGGKQKEKE